MSPSPALPLEVERYVGACLISSHSHQKVKQGEPFYQRERYHQRFPQVHRIEQRCGVPLISYMPNRNPIRPTPDFNLARLAVHTQGAPLILSKTYNHRKNKLHRNQSAPVKPNPQNDAVSVTSDESYGSTSSEQCLPRIIKPRKRRKKDRKTPTFLHQSPDSAEISSDGASPDLPNASRLLTFEFLLPEANNNNLESETPKLHHTFEEIEDVEDTKSSTTTRCQCRYCDPSGQIWDVDKTSYSSFLTPPARNDVFSFPDLSKLTLEDVVPRRASTSDLEVTTQIVTSLNGHRDLEIKFFSASSEEKVYQKNPESC